MHVGVGVDFEVDVDGSMLLVLMFVLVHVLVLVLVFRVRVHGHVGVRILSRFRVVRARGRVRLFAVPRVCFPGISCRRRRDWRCCLFLFTTSTRSSTHP